MQENIKNKNEFESAIEVAFYETFSTNNIKKLIYITVLFFINIILFHIIKYALGITRMEIVYCRVITIMLLSEINLFIVFMIVLIKYYKLKSKCLK